MTSVQLYIDAQDIIENPTNAVKRLTEDIDKNRSIVWTFNPYITHGIHEFLVNSLDYKYKKKFDKLSSNTVLPCWSILPEEYVMKMVEHECEYQEYLFESDYDFFTNDIYDDL